LPLSIVSDNYTTVGLTPQLLVIMSILPLVIIGLLLLLHPLASVAVRVPILVDSPRRRFGDPEPKRGGQSAPAGTASCGSVEPPLDTPASLEVG
jgi:hypothetical protein